MTHKNIVRYYQAWVDGEGEQENNVPENANPELDTVGNDVLEIVEGVGEDSDDEDDSGQGWWASTLDKNGGKGPPKKSQSISEEGESSWGESSFSEGHSSEEDDQFNEDLHQLDFDDDAKDVGLSSPLLSGFGF